MNGTHTETVTERAAYLAARCTAALTGPEPHPSDLVELLRQCRDLLERVQ